MGCLWLLIAILTGCTQVSGVYETYRTLPQEMWIRDSSVSFITPIPEPGNYQLNISLRYTDDYPYAGLSGYWSLCEADTLLAAETFDFTLFGQEKGNPKGRIKTITLPVGSTIPLDTAKHYTFTVSHRMSDISLKGIKNIGIHMIKK